MNVLFRKCVLLSLILYACTVTAWAQGDPYRAEIGVQAGLNSYSGDVNTVADLASYGKNLKNAQPDLGLLFRYRFNQRLALRLGYDYTAVKGSYAFRDGAEIYTATLNNPLHVADLCGEFNFFDLENNPYKRFSKRYTPFVFVGIGVVASPKYKSPESGSSAVTIPLGAGFKWKVADRLNFNIQYTNRFVAGDFLEGKIEFDNPPPKTQANPLNKDRLWGISIGLSYDFWARACDCPGEKPRAGRKPASQKVVKQKEKKEKRKK